MERNRIVGICLLGIIALFFAGCGGGGGGGGGSDPAPKTGTISGTVVDSSGNTVVGAEVTVLSTPLLVASDGSGSFSFSDLEYGTHTLYGTKDGIKFWEKTFTLNGEVLDLGRVQPTSQYPPVDTTDPPSPTLSAVKLSNDNAVQLNWTEVDDPSGIASYRIFKDEVRVSELAGTTWTDSALSFDIDYTYTVKAVDGAGNESVASNSVEINFVSAPNQPPVASISVGNVYFNHEATFDGRGSTDADGTIVSYEWCFDEYCSVSASGSVVKHTYAGSARNGRIEQVSLTVKDDDGREAKTTIPITVTVSPDDLRIVYRDQDNDGYSDGVPMTIYPGDFPDDMIPYTWFTADQLISTTGDCDPWKHFVYPGARESCATTGDTNCDGVVTMPCVPVTMIWADDYSIHFEFRPEDGTLAGITEARIRPEDVESVRFWTPELEGHCGWDSNDSLGCRSTSIYVGSDMEPPTVDGTKIASLSVPDDLNGSYYPVIHLKDGREVSIDFRSPEVKSMAPLVDREIDGKTYTLLKVGNFQLPELEFRGDTAVLRFYEDVAPKVWEAHWFLYGPSTIPTFYPYRQWSLGAFGVSGEQACGWISFDHPDDLPIQGSVFLETPDPFSWVCEIPHMPSSDRGTVQLSGFGLRMPELEAEDPDWTYYSPSKAWVDWTVIAVPEPVVVRPFNVTDQFGDVREITEISYVLP